jgi:hypothetical protein
MGKKAEIVTRIIMLLSIFCMLGVVFSTGCGQQKDPTPPTITINEEDSADWTTVTITFNNHYRDQHGPTYIVLRNPEELAAYREQVEFLLERLEETDRRMNIHTDVPEVDYGVAP